MNAPVTQKQNGYLRWARKWPVKLDRCPITWFPASSRLIGMVRNNRDHFILPPAAVRKAAWRD